MSHEDVVRTVSAIVPCCHMEWPPKQAPNLPWALYHGEDEPIVAYSFQMCIYFVNRPFQQNFLVELVIPYA